MKMDTKRVYRVLAMCVGVGMLAACASNTTTVTNTAPPAAQATVEPSAPAATATAETPATAETSRTATTEAAPAESAATPSAVAETAATSQPAAETIQKLNLNTATSDEFMTVPNVGQRMVREFMEYRPYTSILQFRREIGKYVDEAQVTEYEKYVYVPVSPNDADATTLQQLPGVDQAIADQLIAARPYDSQEAFLNKLATYITPEQLAVAGTYVEAQ